MRGSWAFAHQLPDTTLRPICRRVLLVLDGPDDGGSDGVRVLHVQHEHDRGPPQPPSEQQVQVRAQATPTPIPERAVDDD
eukprot:4095930-Pyramimonas_sp.AAC.1